MFGSDNKRSIKSVRVQTLVGQDTAQIVVGDGISRPALNRPGIIIDSFDKLALFRGNSPEVVECRLVFRLEPQGLVIMGNGLGCPALDR